MQKEVIRKAQISVKQECYIENTLHKGTNPDEH